ncbi:MAG: thioredoxin domain-containing protein [Myxococcota bacterium]|nr:thioredoxin domain-containing protein [Myxococcota bacterium]
MTRHRNLLATLTVPLILSACSHGATSAPPSPVVAEVNGRAITLAQLDEKIASQIYDARSQGLELLIAELVIATEAERRGVSQQELVEQQTAVLGEVTDEEVAQFFASNRARMRPEDTLEKIGPEIRRFLERNQHDIVLRSLRGAANVTIQLEPPRIEVPAVGPSLGRDDAPVTIVEFSDYQCPFCSRAEPTVKQVLAKYPDSVRLVYRHFPLDAIHPQARPAAIAAVCAAQQDHFWEFHDRLFASQSDLSADTLAGFADELELDRAAFEECLTSDAAAMSVEKDLVAGQAAGTTGTPAFFVNGIMLSGARPLDDFVELIEAELAKAQDGV